MRIVPLLLPWLVGPALAQAPPVTPAGDPSVRDDTLYALAVDSADYPDEAFVYLLDDGIVRFEADGRGSRTYRRVVQLLTTEAAQIWGEREFAYARGRERLVLNWVRVVRHDGHMASRQPLREEETPAPVASDAPIYSDARLRRITIGGVEAGTILDYSYTIETLAPVLPGDFYASWQITSPYVIRRSRYIVDVPFAFAPQIQEWNVGFEPREARRRGRRTYTWAVADMPRVEPEPFAAWPDRVTMRVDVAGALDWGDVARWYAGVAGSRYELTPALESQLGEIVATAPTLDDSLRAVHQWVTQDLRYVSLSLGAGSYQPRLPASVLETRYGDCKDKATLFITLARRMGVPAHPVLLSSDGGIERALPSLSQFDHMIVAVERGDGYLFLDLTADLTPFGELPPALQGEFGLVVHDDGRGEQVTLPATPARENRFELVVRGELTEQGEFTGRVIEEGYGTQQYVLRNLGAPRLGDRDRADLAASIASSLFEGGRGDSLVISGGRDLESPARVELVVRAPRALTDLTGVLLFNLPLPAYTFTPIADGLEARQPRRSPIDVGLLVGPGSVRSELEVVLPPGWRVRLPANVTAASAFGTYTAEYAQEDRVLRVVRRIEEVGGTQPPEAVGVLIAWLRAVSADDTRHLLIERAP